MSQETPLCGPAVSVDSAPMGFGHPERDPETGRHSVGGDDLDRRAHPEGIGERARLKRSNDVAQVAPQPIPAHALTRQLGAATSPIAARRVGCTMAVPTPIRTLQASHHVFASDPSTTAIAARETLCSTIPRPRSARRTWVCHRDCHTETQGGEQGENPTHR